MKHIWPNPLQHGDSCRRCAVTTDSRAADGPCADAKQVEAVKRQKKRNDGYAALAKLLPGDNIHSVAPSPINYVDTANALTAAEDKRRRRAAKRAALAK